MWFRCASDRSLCSEVMRDTAADRRKIIEHLEAALALTDQTREAVLGYLIEHALDYAWVASALAEVGSFDGGGMNVNHVAAISSHSRRASGVGAARASLRHSSARAR